MSKILGCREFQSLIVLGQKLNLQTSHEVWTEMNFRGGHLGIFWVGMCRLGLQIGTPF